MPERADWGMDGFSMAYGLNESIPNECRALFEAFLALYRQDSRCATDADCVAFGSCDGINRSGHLEELGEIQKMITVRGCKVGWGNCMPSSYECKNNRCLRRSLNLP